jgi:hypothetical protein
VVREVEQGLLRRRRLIAEVNLGPGGEPLQLRHQGTDVGVQRVGVYCSLAADPGLQQPLRLGNLVAVAEQRQEQCQRGEKAQRHENAPGEPAVRHSVGS